jgi:hypothetical protein
MMRSSDLGPTTDDRMTETPTQAESSVCAEHLFYTYLVSLASPSLGRDPAYQDLPPQLD